MNIAREKERNIRPCINDETLFVKHSKLALQAEFDNFATLQNITWQAELLSQWVLISSKKTLPDATQKIV